ncbi:MAG: 3-deoxy-manno-octulosonate cytidylyltransferase [Fusobacteriaceae bacterium]|nr:3-deoxy-manno-octulosonate cytidylyltransferase [Fusobacteriaceae bacterium]
MKFLGVIPARYSSTRFPGKPLELINGKSMIEWVYKRTIKSDLDKVIVATDDERIYNEVISFGGESILTSKEHETGTDRIAEVSAKYPEYEVIINIQGDEPLIEKNMINSLINPFIEDVDLKMATLKFKLDNIEDINNSNIVKVITDNNNYAIYFSRSPIPYPRHMNIENYYKHIGIYAYEREFLLGYSKLKQTPLEISESLEQLRVLENGYKIKVIETKNKIIGVDTKEDLEKLVEYINKKNITL